MKNKREKIKINDCFGLLVIVAKLKVVVKKKKKKKKFGVALR